MFFFSQFSQLSEDILTASTIIHERRNSLAPINRLPLDVLCLIPTHLASPSDRLQVTFVCRHWRRTFLQYAVLWSKLYLTGVTDQLHMKTLLERAKGSPLDITADYYMTPIPDDVTLVSPFARQIRSLDLKHTFSANIQGLSTAISGPLPLLHTLKIGSRGHLDTFDPPVVPTLPLFEGAANLKNFVLNIDDRPSLRQFTFPNLTTLDFSTSTEEFSISQLLHFLEASPALRQIWMEITTGLFHKDVPSERVVVLSDVNTFCLQITNHGPSCEIETHISCPFAKHVELARTLEWAENRVPEDAYPTSISWNTIARQYTKGTVDRVVLDMMDKGYSSDCSVTFRSPDGTVLKLCCTRCTSGEEFDMGVNWETRQPVVLSQALRTIRDHPLLASVKHLCIKGGCLSIDELELATEGVGRLFESMGPLENLTLNGSDLRPYLDAFFDNPRFPEAIQPTSFPPIKELVVVYPMMLFHEEATYEAAIVELARSQDARGMPLESVKFYTEAPLLLIDELAAFVGTVEYHDHSPINCTDFCV